MEHVHTSLYIPWASNTIVSSLCKSRECKRNESEHNTDCDVTVGITIVTPPTFAYNRRAQPPAQPSHRKFCRFCEETSEHNSKNGRSWNVSCGAGMGWCLYSEYKFIVYNLKYCINAFYGTFQMAVAVLWFYIYIYAFSRRFYPKGLTLYSGYTFLSVCVPITYNDQSAQRKRPTPGYFRKFRNPVLNVSPWSGTPGHTSMKILNPWRHT